MAVGDGRRWFLQTFVRLYVFNPCAGKGNLPFLFCYIDTEYFLSSIFTSQKNVFYLCRREWP